jgi:hypothetical protein
MGLKTKDLVIQNKPMYFGVKNPLKISSEYAGENAARDIKNLIFEGCKYPS